MPSPILARADALMQRRRQGETGPLDDLPVLTDTVEHDDSAPVLHERVALPGNKPAAAPDPLEDATRELSNRVRQRLLAELPELVETTVREFLAERAGNTTFPETPPPTTR